MKREDFPSLLNGLNLRGFGIEIGVATGKFSEILMRSNLKKIYFLDPWREYSTKESPYNDCVQKEHDKRYIATVEKLSKYGDRSEIIREDSTSGLLSFQDNYFDFIYIDANHSYEFIKRDLDNWYPKLKTGGIFSGHDYVYEPPIYCVKLAVDEFCKKINIIPEITEKTSKRCTYSWYWIKK